MYLPTYAPLNSERGGLGDVTRADVVNEARSWLGTPYVHQHRAKGFAVDCVGLLIGVARELGLVDPDFEITPYPRKPDGKTLIAECERLMNPIPDDSLLPGDVLVVAFRRDPQHLGILADYTHGGLSLIHAYGQSDGRGQVEEWGLQNRRKAFRPLRGYALRGVS